MLWRMRSHLLRALVPALFLFAACAAPRPLSTPGGAAISHVVVIWLRPDTAPDLRQQLVADFLRVAGDVARCDAAWIGTPAGTPRDVVDNSYDLLIVLRFPDAAAAAAWQTLPAHQELLGRLRPHLQKLLVYDARD